MRWKALISVFPSADRSMLSLKELRLTVLPQRLKPVILTRLLLHKFNRQDKTC